MSDAGRAANVTDFQPDFASRLSSFRDALTQAGITNSIESGYRSPEYQDQMYQNHLAKKAGNALPYPNVEAPSVVAPAWKSFHNFGLAADFHLGSQADYARMAAMAPQFGLTGIGDSDPGHIQMSGSLGSNVAQYKLAGWRPDSHPAPASGSIAYSGPGGGTTIDAANPPVAGALARPSATTPGSPINDYYHTVMMHESGGKNIPNSVGGWAAAGGYYQFTPATYSTVRAAHPELNLPENIKDANQDQQTAAMKALTGGNVDALQKGGVAINDKNVAMAHFLGPGGAVSYIGQMNQNPGAAAADLFPKEAKSNPTVFYNKDGSSRTLQQVFDLQTASHGPGNTTGFGPDAAPSAAGPAVAGAAPTAAPLTRPPTDQSWWGKLTGTPTDAQGNLTGEKSPLQQMTQMATSRLSAEGQTAKEEAPQGGSPAAEQYSNQRFAPGARNTSPMGGMLLPSVPQTYGQTLNSFEAPLTWNSAPPGAPKTAPAGQQPTPGAQTPGISLTSLGALPGLGLGSVDPNLGYGFG